MKVFEDETLLLNEEKKKIISCGYRVMLYERVGILKFISAATSYQALYVPGEFNSYSNGVSIRTGDFLIIDSIYRDFTAEFYVAGSPIYYNAGIYEGTSGITIDLAHKYENCFLKAGEAHSAFVNGELDVSIVYVRKDVTDLVLKDSLKSIRYQIESSVGKPIIPKTFFRLYNQDNTLIDNENENGIFFNKNYTGTVTNVSEAALLSTLTDTNSDWNDYLAAATIRFISGDRIGKSYSIVSSSSILNTLTIYGNLVTDGVIVGDSYIIEQRPDKYAKIVAGYATMTSDWYLLFGGIIHNKDVGIDNKVISVPCLGHLENIKKNFAFEVTNINGMFRKIDGIKITSSDLIDGAETLYGVKSLRFLFPLDEGIPGLSYNYFVDWAPGDRNRLMKFKSPDEFKFDGGEWTQESVATDDNLTSYDAVDLNCTFSGEYDIRNLTELITITNSEQPEVLNRGRCGIQFDEGPILILNTGFNEGIFYDDSDVSYTDYSSRLDDEDQPSVITIEQVADYIILFSDIPIYGLDLVLDKSSNLVGTFQFSYSQGTSFIVFTPTDNTSNGSVDGTITWEDTDVPEWQPYSGTLGSLDIKDGYGIKIKCSAITSGTLIINTLRKIQKIYGNCGVNIYFTTNYRNLPKVSIEDSIIIKHLEDGSDGAEVGFWWNNITATEMLSKFFEFSNIPASNSTIADFNLIVQNKSVFEIGKCPTIGYRKRPTCVCWDSVNSRLMVGVGNEIWYLDEEGFKFFDKLDIYTGNSNWNSDAGIDYADYSWEIEIWKMEVDANNHLQGLGRFKPQRKDYVPPNEDDDDRRVWARNLPAISFTSTDLVSITSQYQMDNDDLSGGWSRFTSGERTFRVGFYVAGYLLAGRILPTLGLIPSDGENLCLPIPQVLPNPQYGYYTPALDQFGSNSPTIDTLNGVLETSTAPTIFGKLHSSQYMFSLIDVGLLIPHDGDGCIGFSLGQDGFCVWYDGNFGGGGIVDEGWFYIDNPDKTNYGLGVFHTDGSQTAIYTYGDYKYNILCGDGPNALYIVFLSEIFWDDGTNAGILLNSINRIVSITMLGVRAVLFDFSIDTPEVGSSLSGADIEYGTIISMVYDSIGNTLHGCLLARNTFEYHFYVYDITNDKLYVTQTGSNFTFSSSKQLIKGHYNTTDGKVYWYYVDLRYRTDTTVVVRSSFTGGTITLEQVDFIKFGEYLAGSFLTEGDNGAIYGVTAPNSSSVFILNEVYQLRLLYPDFGYDDIAVAATKVVNMSGYNIIIYPERLLVISERFSQRSTTILSRYELIKVKKFKEYPYQYDGILVPWKDENGNEGIEWFGEVGLGKEVFTLGNNLVQDPHLAVLLVNVLWNLFVSTRKYFEEGKLAFIHQLELKDAFTISVPKKFTDGQSQNTYYMIDKLDFNLSNWTIDLSAIEISIDNGGFS